MADEKLSAIEELCLKAKVLSLAQWVNFDKTKEN